MTTWYAPDSRESYQITSTGTPLVTEGVMGLREELMTAMTSRQTLMKITPPPEMKESEQSVLAPVALAT